MSLTTSFHITMMHNRSTIGLLLGLLAIIPGGPVFSDGIRTPVPDTDDCAATTRTKETSKKVKWRTQIVQYGVHGYPLGDPIAPNQVDQIIASTAAEWEHRRALNQPRFEQVYGAVFLKFDFDCPSCGSYPEITNVIFSSLSGNIVYEEVSFNDSFTWFSTTGACDGNNNLHLVLHDTALHAWGHVLGLRDSGEHQGCCISNANDICAAMWWPMIPCHSGREPRDVDCQGTCYLYNWSDVVGSDEDEFDPSQCAICAPTPIALTGDAVAESDGIRLRWQAIEAPIECQIRRSPGRHGKPELQIALDGSIREYLDGDVAPGKSYDYQIAVKDRTGSWEYLGVRATALAAIASVAARPNPVVLQLDKACSFTFATTVAGEVSVMVVDVEGRFVRRITKNVGSPGAHEIVWNMQNENGESVGSGLYFWEVRFQNSTLARKKLTVFR